ncbi:MAG: hypothetical protein SFZ03_00550 [Candidatus Melainabacteria bacterium]|nr:hypothetical protein [Candidatus Melainabacteria bacterium]
MSRPSTTAAPLESGTTNPFGAVNLNRDNGNDPGLLGLNLDG